MLKIKIRVSFFFIVKTLLKNNQSISEMNSNSSDQIKEPNPAKEANLLRPQTNGEPNHCGKTVNNSHPDDVILKEGEVHFEIIGDTTHLFSPEDFIKKEAYYETTKCA